MITTSLLRRFGLDRRGTYRSSLHDALELEIREAVGHRQICAVVGPFGAGKTQLVGGALGTLSGATRICRVHDPNREHQKISHVMNAGIYDLSNEHPRRDAEARARQFIRIVYEHVAIARGEVVIVVENAHRLHHRTLMAIKDAREMGYADVSGPLYSVLLIGQGGLKTMLERQPEVGHRTTRIDLSEDAGWMTLQERISYLEQVYDRAIEEGTRRRIAEMHSSPLAMDAAVERAMRTAALAGLSVIDGSSVQLSLRELRESAEKISLAQISKAAGLPRQAVADVIRTGDADPRSPAVRAALERLAETPAKAA